MITNLITGFFGVNNLGDDIMLDAFYSKIDAKDRVRLLKLFSGADIETQIKSTDISMFPHGKRLIVDQLLSRRYNGLYWIGGTCFTETGGDGAYGYMHSFKNKGKKVGYIGIGINEINNSERRKIFKNILEKADLVTIRDIDSFNVVRNLAPKSNAILTEDLVYLSDSIFGHAIRDNKHRLLIAWRSLSGYYKKEVEEKAINSLIYTVQHHIDEYDEVIISPLGNAVDIDVNKVIFERMKLIHPHVIYNDEKSFNGKISIILKSATVITGRLHGIFVSEWNNIKTVAIGYDTKIVSFLNSINRQSDIVFPDAMEPDAIEHALHCNHPNLTICDWENKRKQSMMNIQLFECQ